MAIKDKDISSNLQHNYGLVFKEMLVRYKVQSKFYTSEIEIGKNSWKSTCDGKTYLKNEDELYDLTKVDKSILKGTQKLEITTLTECKNRDEYLNELENFLNLYDDNSNDMEENIKKGDYDRNFIKVFRYVISLTSKISNSVEDKFKLVLDNLDLITSKDYMNVDIDVLEKYKKELDEHINVASSATMVRKFKN